MRDTVSGDAEPPGAGRQRAMDTVLPGVRRQSGRALRLAFVLDVAGYGIRTVPERDDIQRRLRRFVVLILGECALKLDGVDHQWSGDGINAILPADIDPIFVLTVLIRSLAAALSRDNARNVDRIRLRMAIGVGIIERGAAGFGGPVIVDINRLVDSSALRQALDDDPAADLAVAISDQVHALIIEPGYPGIPRGQFSEVNVVAKEFSGPAWIWLSTRQWSEPAYGPLSGTDPREAGGYRIVARLGAGQGGRVYLANGAAGDWVALKVFDRRLAADPEARRHLSLGVLAARVIRDPHLTSVIAYDTGTGTGSDTGSGTGQPWAASTLVRGPSLAAAVTETGPVPAATAGWIALGMARALVSLHRVRLIHSAVTPHNVVLDAHGAVLTDFGTSRAVLIGGPATEADDVFRFGVTTFFAATGRSPWGDRPATEAPGEPDLTGCPSWLANIVRACLAADPAARPTAARLHARLAEETGQQPRFWLPEPVAARIADYQALPPSRGRLRWPRGREQ